MVTTRAGKKMKKCSKSGWDREKREPTGCDYIEWFNGTREDLDEECPQCGKKLVLVTTAAGKKMKKCSDNRWDKEKRQSVGCNYVQWMNSKSSPDQKKNTDSNGDVDFPSYEM